MENWEDLSGYFMAAFAFEFVEKLPKPDFFGC